MAEEIKKTEEGYGTTVNELRTHFMGLMWHIGELSSYMIKHKDDPYFETDEGKTIRACVAKLGMTHIIGMTTLESCPGRIKTEEKEEPTDEKEEKEESVDIGGKLFGMMFGGIMPTGK